MGKERSSVESVGFVMPFWKGKKVLITGHTGFKGSWISIWLQKLGAEVMGFSMEPPTSPNLFSQAEVGSDMQTTYGDIRDFNQLKQLICSFEPEIIFHMAAQSLVRKSYLDPLETFSTNIIGTANLFEAARSVDSLRVIINVTSDKCYDNKEWIWGYRENEPLGGSDPYSASKGCAELITTSYRSSFFSDGPSVASVRAGNVIGGGDWAEDRLVPDIIRSIVSNKIIFIRNPRSVRPWQHVLEPLYGYLLLAERMWFDGKEYGDSWNIGPGDQEAVSVETLLRLFENAWGESLNIQYDDKGNHPHEANYLRLDCSKAKLKLGWSSLLSVDTSIDWVVDWTRAYIQGEDMRRVTLNQISYFEEIIKEHSHHE